MRTGVRSRCLSVLNDLPPSSSAVPVEWPPRGSLRMTVVSALLVLSRLRRGAYLPLYWLVTRCSQRDFIIEDLWRSRFLADHELSRRRRRGHLVEALQRPEVRTVLYYRLGRGTPGERLAAKLLERLVPGLRSLEIRCPDIGPGFVVAHGFASVLGAARIGRDCVVHHQVTLGNRVRAGAAGFPTIGDRVVIYPGAIVLGAVHIGDDAIIGAGAIVLEDVPARATAIGAPARAGVVRSSDD